MIRRLVLVALLAPAAASAQSPGEAPRMDMHGMTHGHAQSRVPAQSGQSAFAAIQEIAGILEADPKTDWAKADIDALRQHLVDMNNVTLAASVKREAIDGGVRFLVTGEGPVRESIRRMVLAHAAMMDGADSWHFEAAEIADGASLVVHAPSKDLAKLNGLGFFGLITRGMHHQMHHLMIARGEHPHR